MPMPMHMQTCIRMGMRACGHAYAGGACMHMCMRAVHAYHTYAYRDPRHVLCALMQCSLGVMLCSLTLMSMRKHVGQGGGSACAYARALRCGQRAFDILHGRQQYVC